VDKKAYLDLSLFEDLHSRFGAQGGPFADAYVLAPEYGHQVQDLVRLVGRARSNTVGQKRGSVRTELQADCPISRRATSGNNAHKALAQTMKAAVRTRTARSSVAWLV
jgi:predicted metalloprotease